VDAYKQSTQTVGRSSVAADGGILHVSKASDGQSENQHEIFTSASTPPSSIGDWKLQSIQQIDGHETAEDSMAAATVESVAKIATDDAELPSQHMHEGISDVFGTPFISTVGHTGHSALSTGQPQEAGTMDNGWKESELRPHLRSAVGNWDDAHVSRIQQIGWQVSDPQQTVAASEVPLSTHSLGEDDSLIRPPLLGLTFGVFSSALNPTWQSSAYGNVLPSTTPPSWAVHNYQGGQFFTHASRYLRCSRLCFQMVLPPRLMHHLSL
jgi:hypothetical protein